jgi:hypothetical protein
MLLIAVSLDMDWLQPAISVGKTAMGRHMTLCICHGAAQQ